MSITSAAAALRLAPRLPPVNIISACAGIRLKNKPIRIMKTPVYLLLVLICTTLNVRAQQFQNLDFESAVIQKNNPTYGWLDWNLAAPGWSPNPNGVGPVIFYGQRHLGIEDIYFLSDANGPAGGMPSQLAGRYSMTFASGIHPFYYTPVPAWISQTGAIPPDTKSIQMLVTGPFDVFVGGTQINMVSLGGNLYGGDVSAFAGLTEELKIVSDNGWRTDINTEVDNIRFSTMIVPEPSALAMMGLGLLGLRLRKWS